MKKTILPIIREIRVIRGSILWVVAMCRAKFSAFSAVKLFYE
jgi:hypothetical protein